MCKFGAFAQGKAQAQAHGVGYRQNVAEQNGSIQRVTLQGLKRHFSSVVGVCRQAHKAARLGA